MSLVCIDTQVLIWGIQESAASGQEPMIARAQQLLDALDTGGTRGLIPSLVIGEFLSGMPEESHAAVVNLLRKGFVTAAYDLKAAAMFAKLWKARQVDGTVSQLRTSGAKRQEIKADGMIVASAIAHGASHIVSHDPHLRRFAADTIEVKDLPSLPAQLALI